MPISIDPQPKENELECPQCGSYFYYELVQCPACGAHVYEPEEDINDDIDAENQGGLITKVQSFLRRVFGKPYSAEEVFGDGLDRAALYNDLLSKVGGDHLVVERLIEFEQQQRPDRMRLVWLQDAIWRWERDNRTPGEK